MAVLVMGCTHAQGDCSHVNDIPPVARPASVTMLSPTGGAGHGLTSGESFIIDAAAPARNLTVIWRACNQLNRVTVAETALTVTIDGQVSGCPPGGAGVPGPPPTGDQWYSTTVHLSGPLAGREIVSAHGVFCDIVIH